MRDKLEGEITRPQELGVIEKVEQPTDWVSGLVVAEKKEWIARDRYRYLAAQQGSKKKHLPNANHGRCATTAKQRKDLHSLRH